MQKAFTLIELLVAIAIVGIIAAAVLVAINPAQKIKQGNDSKAKSDIGQIATALTAYYVSHQYYPDSSTASVVSTDLTTSNELTDYPTVPNASYTYAYTAQTTAGGACTDAAKNCAKFSISATLLAPVT